MKIIDLTLPMHTGMPVYPGDPEASIELIQTLEKDGWNMRRVQINTHDGTHVNAPVHGVEEGKTLDDYPLEAFFGPAKIYKPGLSVNSNTGVIFRDHDIDQSAADWIKQTRPHFVGLSSKYEVNTDIEKELLKEEVVLFERLANCEQLPDEFMFYGTPLKIKEGDGSPVRAFAVIG